MKPSALAIGAAFAIAAAVLGLSLVAFSRPAAAVNQIGLNETCGDGGIKRDLISWPSGDPRATQTFVDLSLGSAGNFTTYGPYGARSGVTFVGIPYQTGVFVRIRQVLPGGVTDVSPVFSFQTSWCGFNFFGQVTQGAAFNVGNPTPTPSATPTGR